MPEPIEVNVSIGIDPSEDQPDYTKVAQAVQAAIDNAFGERVAWTIFARPFVSIWKEVMDGVE